jgi:competence protein ComEA
MITLTRAHAVVLALGVLVVLTLVGKRLAVQGAAQAPERTAALSPAAAAPSTRIVVHVVGAVRRPGLYRVSEGARVADAVERAGGMTRRAESTGVNLAAPLADGAQVLVPIRVTPGTAGAASPGKVSLATATPEQLDELPGVGPVTAEKIVAWRAANGPFRTVDDLDRIPGIGPARIEQLRELVTP